MRGLGSLGGLAVLLNGGQFAGCFLPVQCLKKKDAALATRLLALVEDSGNYGIVSNLNFFM